jgi:hypothetical protein
MKHSSRFLLALALLLSLSSALAQVPDSHSDVRSVAAHEPSPAIALARCQYTPGDETCAEADASGQSSSRVTALEMLAQMSRRGGPPMPRGRMSYGRGYPSSYAGNGRHAVIGALIGFGIGAALGAKANQDPHPGVTLKASLLVGFIGAGLGAAIGAGAPSFRARNLGPRLPGEHRKRLDDDQVAGELKAARASGN